MFEMAEIVSRAVFGLLKHTANLMLATTSFLHMCEYPADGRAEIMP